MTSIPEHKFIRRIAPDSAVIFSKYVRDYVLPAGWILKRAARREYLRNAPFIDALRRIADREKIMVDVGANFGVFAYLLGSEFRSVQCFEPHPRAAQFLRRANLPNTSVNELALGDRSGQTELLVPDRAGNVYVERSSLHEFALSDIGSFASLPIKCARLDELGLEHVGLIKIDVEGHEEAVIRGGQDLIRAQKPHLFVEIEQRHIQRNIGDVFSFIESLGYAGLYFDEEGAHPLRDFSVDKNQLAEINNRTSLRYVNNFLFLQDSSLYKALMRR